MLSIRPIKKKVKKEESLQRLNDRLVLAQSDNDQKLVRILKKCISRVEKLKE